MVFPFRQVRDLFRPDVRLAAQHLLFTFPGRSLRNRFQSVNMLPGQLIIVNRLVFGGKMCIRDSRNRALGSGRPCGGCGRLYLLAQEGRERRTL